MPKLSSLFSLALATVFTTAAFAQTADPAGQLTSTYTQNQPAPIQREAPGGTMPPPPSSSYQASLAPGQLLAPSHGIADTQPATGVYLRVAAGGAVREVSSTPQRIEFRVERGLANLNIHHADKGQIVLVDLPGGQVQPYKNGFYTFNATTDTVRVLVGEADAFPAGSTGVKPVKVKEDHAVIFPPAGNPGVKLQSAEFYPVQARADIIPAPYQSAEPGDGPRYFGYGYPAYGFYGYPYPYYAYGWGYPYYGYGYPFGVGIGFGYYGGGFYRGGFYGRR